MTQHFYKNLIRWGIITATLFIVSLILWNTYTFFQQFKDEERIKVEILAAALQRFNDPDLDADMNLEIQITNSNHSIPLIWVDEKGKIVTSNNLDKAREKDTIYLQKQLVIMKSQNKPILVQYVNSPTKQYIYYKDSEILTNLKYYPLGLILILALFSLVIFLFNTSNRVASQNKLWTGMAKETAHQIGTPLTSLLGWIAILREEDNEEIANEIEKDVVRLEVIANRFSKIGSETPLVSQNIVDLTNNSFAYLKSRTSKQINYTFNSSSDEIMVKTNSDLYGWVIENLVKNAIDAMHGKGEITLSIKEKGSQVLINVSDSGKGIAKNMHKQIFEPGFTTKKRGWGLGLSLSKRIIEDFHQGKIFVKKSTADKGTIFCIKLPIA